MHALVTGVAGFIGSNLASRLLADGWSVRGLDSFTAYYDPRQKRANVAPLLHDDRFELVEADLLDSDLDPVVHTVDVVFHQAGQPGVRPSWAEGFGDYTRGNIDATQRLLEAARRTELQRFVFASSSSVYGNASAYPTSETDRTAPFSPYGVTKLAAEHLCNAYAENFGVPITSLRYFTVYGPAQRPDMAIHRMIRTTQSGDRFPVYGDGSQIRDFTFVGDVVDANLAAATAALDSGTVINVAGGGSVTLAELIEAVGRIVGRSVPVEYRPAQPGDVTRTGGSTARATELLGWAPRTSIDDGIAAQVEWQCSRLP